MEVGSLSANRNLIIFLIIILELVGGGYYYMFPLKANQQKLKDLNVVVEKKSREVREVEMTKKLLAEKRKEIERLKTEIARLERFFPEEVFIPRVLVLLENLAEATHLSIGTIKPGTQAAAGRRPGTPPSAVQKPAGAEMAQAPTPTVGPAARGNRAVPGNPAAPGAGPGDKTATKFDSNREYKTINVDFDVKGTFQNISNFMNELTTFPKLVVVDTLDLTPSTKSGSDTNSQTEKEVEVGASAELAAKMPLTFYIQQTSAPEF